MSFLCLLHFGPVASRRLVMWINRILGFSVFILEVEVSGTFILRGRSQAFCKFF
jgi:hypothetical protein